MIKMSDIIREGDTRLNQKSVEVTLPFSKEDQETLEAMIEYIENSVDEEIAKKYKLRAAVGLSAVQIGILKRMLVIWTPDEKGKEHFYAMVNPKLVSYSDELTYLPMGEGCLSVDREVEGYVHRARKVTVKTLLYQGGNLVPATIRLKGYLSVVFLHEYDHLQGILFTDRINKENPFFIPENSTPIAFPKAEEENDKDKANS